VHESEWGKGFVRSYKREREYSSHSGTDEAIEAFLQSQGYAKWRGWPDHTRLMRYSLRREGFLMPYIDGNCQHVDEDGDDRFRISSYDGWEACNTSGMLNGYACTCDDCGAGMDEDDSYSIGYHGDSRVGPCCIDDYTHVYGRRGDTYYVNSDNAVEVDGEWYHLDDDRICRTTDTDEYLLCDNGCWQCEESGNWYTDSVDYVEVDDKKYHPSRAPATDDAEEGGDTAVAVAPVVTTPATTVMPKQLTMEMLNECALVEEHCPITQRVTYSIRIMHNGNLFIASRTYRDGFIESQGVDWMRVNVRRIISNELLGVPASTFDSI
jgi:hypothetical protein